MSCFSAFSSFLSTYSSEAAASSLLHAREYMDKMRCLSFLKIYNSLPAASLQ